MGEKHTSQGVHHILLASVTHLGVSILSKLAKGKNVFQDWESCLPAYCE